MTHDLMSFNNNLMQKYAAADILQCNRFTASHALVLNQQQAVELVQTRTVALQDYGRVEFGGGVIDKMIKEFYTSPYLSQHNYTETLHELIEMFYYYKNETLDLISDDELLKLMHQSFDGICQGSLELLAGREMAQMATNLRCGRAATQGPEDSDTEREKEDDENGKYCQD